MSTADATAAGDAAARAPLADERRDRLRADVVHGELVAGVDETRRHRLAHLAEADETDVLGHDAPPRGYGFLPSISANTSRAQRNDSTAAGTPQ